MTLQHNDHNQTAVKGSNYLLMTSSRGWSCRRAAEWRAVLKVFVAISVLLVLS